MPTKSSLPIMLCRLRQAERAAPDADARCGLVTDRDRRFGFGLVFVPVAVVFAVTAATVLVAGTVIATAVIATAVLAPVMPVRIVGRVRWIVLVRRRRLCAPGRAIAVVRGRPVRGRAPVSVRP